MESIELDYTDKDFRRNMSAAWTAAKKHDGRKGKILIDIIIKPSELGGDRRYFRRERIVWMSEDEIIGLGYRKAKGFQHTAVAWMGIPMYAKISNGRVFDVHVAGPEGWAYPQDTAFTLRDYLDSGSTENFVKAMHKAQMPNALDLQKIVMIGVLVAGVLLGLMMLGGH